MATLATIDDLARDYVNMGIDDPYEIFPCRHCGASVMPWYLRCENCGENPTTSPAPERWTCGVCQTGDYESRDDAERCCTLDTCFNCENEIPLLEIAEDDLCFDCSAE